MPQYVKTDRGRRVVYSEEERERIERAARRQMHPTQASAVKDGVRIDYNLYHADGSLVCDAGGKPVVMTAGGAAVLARFVKPLPSDYKKPQKRDARTGKLRDLTEEEFAELEAKQGAKGVSYHSSASACVSRKDGKDPVKRAHSLAKQAPTSEGTHGVCLLKCDDNETWQDGKEVTADFWLVFGDYAALAWWVRKCRDEELLDVVEILENRRVPVVAAGSSSPATEGAKRALRETRTPKVHKILRKSVAHTTDEQNVAGLCRCVSCGKLLTDHDDSACVSPAFVADGAALAEEKEANVKGASAAVRSNRFRSSRAAAQGIDLSLPPELRPMPKTPGACNDGPTAPRATDAQRKPSEHCGKCSARLDGARKCPKCNP